MSSTIAVYKTLELEYIEETDKIVASFSRQSGQGSDVIRKIVENQSDFDLGGLYALELVPASPEKKVEQIPPPKVQLTPEPIPQATPQLVPTPTPQPIPQATPQLVPAPTPQPIPQAIPQFTPEPLPALSNSTLADVVEVTKAKVKAELAEAEVEKTKGELKKVKEEAEAEVAKAKETEKKSKEVIEEVAAEVATQKEKFKSPTAPPEVKQTIDSIDSRLKKFGKL